MTLGIFFSIIKHLKDEEFVTIRVLKTFINEIKKFISNDDFNSVKLLIEISTYIVLLLC